MKTILLSFPLLAVSGTLAFSQVTYIFDQQSATNDAVGNYATGTAFDGNLHLGQSFIPALSAIDFVRLQFKGADRSAFTGASGLVWVNLWSGGISNGVLLAATAPVFVSVTPVSVAVATNFFFATSFSVTPGATYYFQPFIQPQVGTLGVEIYSLANNSGPRPSPLYVDSYSAGNMVPSNLYPGQDLWFREGIVAVPEPAAGALLFVAAVAWLVRRLVNKTPDKWNSKRAPHPPVRKIAPAFFVFSNGQRDLNQFPFAMLSLTS